MRRKCEDLAVDVVGLCLTARNEDYVKAALAGWDEEGACTAIGHARPMSAAGAAFVNGTAAHGEDFDDTFEGGPVHAGAVIVPAVLAACERYNPDGSLGAAGHRGRHRGDLPAQRGGAEGRAQGGLSSDRGVRRHGARRPASARRSSSSSARWSTRSASPARWPAASSNTSPRAPGPSGCIRAGRRNPGLRAALLGRHGFLGPRTVFEGVHGLFHGFAHTTTGNYDALIGDFGAQWVTQTLAFKPYPCGTMTHPYIDCARRLAARGIKAEEIKELVCEVGEGTVHRLWEPLAAKQRPANGYAGKFSTPYCIAHAFVRGQVGLDAFTDDAVQEPDVLALASKVRYQIDPQNPYPNNFTGHIRALLADGSVVEERQPHLRGGAHEPLSRGDIEEKFVLNARHGGWDAARTERALALLRTLYDGKIDLSSLRG